MTFDALGILNGLANAAYGLSRWFITAALGVIVGVVAVQVYTRYILNDSAVWTTEVAVLLLIWMLYIGASMAVRDKEMVAITILVDRLPEAGRHVANLLANLCLAVFFVAMIALNREVIEMSTTTPFPVLRISKLWAHLALSVGFGLTLFYLVVDSIASIRALNDRSRATH